MNNKLIVKKKKKVPYGVSFLLCMLTQIPNISQANIVDFPRIKNQPHAQWDCTCQNEGQCTIEKIQGKQVLTVPPLCEIETKYAYPNEKTVQAIRLQISSMEEPGSNIYLAVLQHEGSPGVSASKLRVKTIAHNKHFDTTTAYANRIQFHQPILVVNNTSSEPLHILKARVHQSKRARIGSILKAEGGGHQGSYSYDSPFPDFAWIPLPLDYKNQVPLYVHLNIQPQSLIQSIQYQVDDIGNWGASIHFVPNIANGTKLDFSWDVSVLTNDDTKFSQQFIANNAEWLQSTDIVQSSDKSIQTEASSLLAPDSNIETVTNIVSWTATHIKFGIDDSRLDALHVYEAKMAACTGYANLAAALGRSLNIPTMTLAGYLVGLKQETHWINEFYLGDKQGWLRVEPQGRINVDSEYFIPVRVDRISDEIIWDFLIGIPKYAYPIIPVDFERPNKNYYLVEAFNAIEFTNSPDVMNKVFGRARQSWQKDFATLLNAGYISPNRQAIRYKLSKAQTLTEMDQLLTQLDNVE